MGDDDTGSRVELHGARAEAWRLANDRFRAAAEAAREALDVSLARAELPSSDQVQAYEDHGGHVILRLSAHGREVREAAFAKRREAALAERAPAPKNGAAVTPKPSKALAKV